MYNEQRSIKRFAASRSSWFCGRLRIFIAALHTYWWLFDDTITACGITVIVATCYSKSHFSHFLNWSEALFFQKSIKIPSISIYLTYIRNDTCLFLVQFFPAKNLFPKILCDESGFLSFIYLLLVYLFIFYHFL